MAIISKSDLVMGDNSPLTKDRYTVRVLEAVIKPTKKGDSALNTKVEIVSPKTINVGGTTYNCAGRRFYLMPNLIDPSVAWGLGQIQAALEKSEFDFQKFGAGGDIDTDRFGCLVGHEMDMVLQTVEDYMTREATAAEVASGAAQPGGKVNLLDTKGQPILRAYAVVGNNGKNVGWADVIGAASGEWD
jgi:hypothetical protein